MNPQRNDFLKQLYDIFDAVFTTKMPTNVENNKLPTIQTGLVYATQCVGNMLYKHKLGLDVLHFKDISLMYDEIENEFIVTIPMINDVHLEFIIVLLKANETVTDQLEPIANDFIKNGIRGICTSFSLNTDTFNIKQDIASPHDILDSRLMFALDIHSTNLN